MASSAFKSTTKRASIGASGSDDSGRCSLRRSRSLSRLPHPMAPDPDSDADYNKNVPRGKFVNTTRGSPTTPFPEISLDDLALELFSSSSKNDNESDGIVVERKEREGRSVSRRGDVGRWASDTASSRRKGRSVSRTRGDFVSGSAASVAKNVNSSDEVSRRRRSLSVARFQVSDSESEVDHFRNLSNCATVKAPFKGDCQLSSVQKTVASSNRRVGRSRSLKDCSSIHDGYSSHSSALTDEESKDTHFGKNGFEKIIRAVHAQKAEHPNVDVTDGGLYEAMRKEVRYAVQEIRTELNHAMGRNQIALASGDYLLSDQDFSRVPEKYATKLEQLEKHKQDLFTEMLLEEQQGEEIPKLVKELPYSRPSAIVEKPSRARKRSSDKSRMSTKLFEEAERYFEDFICNNIEDTDISSFDGERSDVSSSVGGKMKERDEIIREPEAYKIHAEFTSQPDSVEMDGVILPWLQWETSPDGSLSGTKMAPSPSTPKARQRDSEKDMVFLSDLSSHSISSHGSWNPGLFNTPPVVDRKAACEIRQVDNDCLSSRFDMDEYLNHRSNEELLFEIYSHRNRINSGGMLVCTGGFH